MLEIIILAVIEGITEFLPVSSTGHLIIAQKALGAEVIDEFITVILQAGAILAAVCYFRSQIFQIIRNSYRNFRQKQLSSDLGLWILIATIPALLLGFALKDVLDILQNNSYLIAFTTIVFGILFLYIERSSLRLPAKDLSLRTVLSMGIFQALAILPGVSRSGITVSGGLKGGQTFSKSIEIAFIMGIPVLFIATAYEIVKHAGNLAAISLPQIIIGTGVSFAVSLLSIKLTLGLLNKTGFLPFTIYRIFLGIGILLFLA